MTFYEFRKLCEAIDFSDYPPDKIAKIYKIKTTQAAEWKRKVYQTQGWDLGLNIKTINNFRQNSPELIVRDAKVLLRLDEEQCQILRKILLARGVNKWLKARRDIIRLKHEIKQQIINLNKIYEKWNPSHKATLKMLNYFRQELRKICHQPRWVEWPSLTRPNKAEKFIIIKGPHS